MGNIRYIGSKLRIASQIINAIPFSSHSTFCDIFSGTGAISRAAGIAGWKVNANDYLLSAKVLTTAQLICNEEIDFKNFGGYSNVINLLNNISGLNGPITKEYSPSKQSASGHDRLYFTYENALKIDGIRKQIEDWFLCGIVSSKEYSLLLSDLLRATNSVANIAGTYGGYLKKIVKTSIRPILLDAQPLLDKRVNYNIFQKDVFDFKSDVNDIVYMDPPYTKRQYPAYYHILETIAHGDYPNVNGITGLRPWQHLASRFCYKKQALDSLIELIENIGAFQFYISYSSAGHININDLIDQLNNIGEVQLYDLGNIGKYRPNIKAVQNSSFVTEYLICFRLNKVYDKYLATKNCFVHG